MDDGLPEPPAPRDVVDEGPAPSQTPAQRPGVATPPQPFSGSNSSNNASFTTGPEACPTKSSASLSAGSNGYTAKQVTSTTSTSTSTSRSDTTTPCGADPDRKTSDTAAANSSTHENDSFDDDGDEEDLAAFDPASLPPGDFEQRRRRAVFTAMLLLLERGARDGADLSRLAAAMSGEELMGVAEERALAGWARGLPQMAQYLPETGFGMRSSGLRVGHTGKHLADMAVGFGFWAYYTGRSRLAIAYGTTQTSSCIRMREWGSPRPTDLALSRGPCRQVRQPAVPEAARRPEHPPAAVGPRGGPGGAAPALPLLQRGLRGGHTGLRHAAWRPHGAPQAQCTAGHGGQPHRTQVGLEGEGMGAYGVGVGSVRVRVHVRVRVRVCVGAWVAVCV